MIEIIAIAAMDDNLGVGYRSNLPWPRKIADLRRFKELTMGHYVVVGRRTFESMPDLPGRNVIVVASQDHESYPMRADSVESAITLAVHRGAQRLFLAGGVGVWEEGAQFATKLLLTKIVGSYMADTYFPFEYYAGKLGHQKTESAENCFFTEYEVVQ